MPVIIWGSRGLTSEQAAGTYYCPQCDSEQGYRLMSVRPFFTLFFIPIFPIGGATRYVECQRCRGTFKEGVLEMQPPTEGERLLRQLYHELLTGSSVETIRDKMVSMGMEKDQAERIVGQMTEGQTWACSGCGDHYLSSVKKCLKCPS
jgi:hypothetical protein